MKKTLIRLISALGLGALLLSTAVAASQAAGRTLEVSASITPKMPATGENRLEAVITEAGQPVTGLKLTSRVGMTNMDMGTAEPPVKEASPGHYVVRPMFLMAGPWRVILSSKAPKFEVSFDIKSGSKQPWLAAKKTVIIAGAASGPTPPKQESKTSPAAQAPTPPSPKPADLTPRDYVLPMEEMGHAVLSMPQLEQKSSYTVTGAEDWEVRTGFGKLAPMVRMMILMMVTGSGMEGMNMAPMEMLFDEANFTESADTTVQSSRDEASAGRALKVGAALERAKVGDNRVFVTIGSPEGEPIEQASIAADVSMTSMDMGTAHPAVKELGKGKYLLTASFSMAGPWRLRLSITPRGGKPETYLFNYEVK